MKKLLLSLALFSASTLSVSALSDISGSDFKTYINNAQSQNIISGYDDGTFRPNNPVSFIESLKIITNTGPYAQRVAKDDSQEWYTKFVNFYNTNQKTPTVSFGNNEAITRDFAVYLMLRQLDIELEGSDMSQISASFPDVDTSIPLAPYILFAKYAGITDGYSDGTFGPKNKVSRWELTKMVWRTLREDSTKIQEKYLDLVVGGLLKTLEQ